MPLYEFRCPEGHDFEKFYRSIGAAPPDERCPECGAIAARLMSTAGLVFKGSGFYITDYGKDGKKAERDAATAKAAAKTDAPAEQKTADTAPSKAAETTAAETTAAETTAAPVPAKPAAESKSQPAAAKPAPASKKE